MLPRGKYPAPAVSARLTYGGGPLLVSPIVYVVFWGYSASDPVAARLIELYQHVGGSGWFGAVTQYCNAQDVPIQNTSNILGGAWSDATDAVPNHPTQTQIAAEAELAVKHFAIGSVIANATVVIATPTGKSEVGFGTQFCGWHDYTGANALSYEYIPYKGPTQGSSCASQLRAGSARRRFLIVGGHEVAESTTDPLPLSGWTDTANGEEIADLCAWQNLQAVNLTGVSLPMQPLFSNLSGACEQ